ncbi:response regulator [Mucilaginibacter lutimaris]|uniref:Response regulator n=1 Tax=Mucilaginibacter lutimaris TaxID=931629 RepID=A0ABW2ZGB9_9SPHI
MFKNVLIAEDHESASISIQKTLSDLGIDRAHYTYYCDDALTRVRKGMASGEPYELLITDLSFEDDGSPQVIKTGAGLIEEAKKICPSLKVLVFSAEQNPVVISELFHRLEVSGFVRKARRDAQELKAAIEAIAKNKRHYPLEFRQDIRQKNAYNFTGYDVTLISLLSKGVLQKNIPAYLAEHKISPSGLSSVEKRFNQIREALGFSKNEQLVAYCKDKGII